MEPDGFENIWQIGYKLSDTLASGAEALQAFTVDPVSADSGSLISASQA